MPRPALASVSLALACLALLAGSVGCQPKAKPINKPELEPLLVQHLQMSRALAYYTAREQMLARMGGAEDFQALAATSARYAAQGVTSGEIGSLKVEAGYIAERYFEKLAGEIEAARTWPSGNPEVWRERARLALASARRDFAYQFAVNGDLGGVIHSTDRIRRWMKGEAKPVLGPPSDWVLPQMLAQAGTNGPDQPQRPAPTATSNPPTALAIPVPSSQ